MPLRNEKLITSKRYACKPRHEGGRWLSTSMLQNTKTCFQCDRIVPFFKDFHKIINDPKRASTHVTPEFRTAYLPGRITRDASVIGDVHAAEHYDVDNNIRSSSSIPPFSSRSLESNRQPHNYSEDLRRQWLWVPRGLRKAFEHQGYRWRAQKQFKSRWRNKLMRRCTFAGDGFGSPRGGHHRSANDFCSCLRAGELVEEGPGPRDGRACSF